jgi:hypothetical protein
MAEAHAHGRHIRSSSSIPTEIGTELLARGGAAAAEL